MVLKWLDPSLPSLLPELLLLFGLALIVSSIGFYRVVYFISVGYAFSIVGMALVTPLRHLDNLGWASALQTIFLLIWGVRLGLFLVQRELRSSYSKAIAEVHERSARMSLGTKALIWVGVSVLYVLMFSPSLFGLTASPSSSPWLVALVQALGLVIMGGGLLLETVSDKQKSDFKAHHPFQFCDVGLYQYARCPNYLGEIGFWVGNWILGIPYYDSPLKWIASLIGMVCIVLIMMGSTKRLEESQDSRYGSQPSYQTYVRTVPVLVPFVPIYSLKNLRVFLE